MDAQSAASWNGLEGDMFEQRGADKPGYPMDSIKMNSWLTNISAQMETIIN